MIIKNFKILILIAVILTLIMVMLVRERQHAENIIEYLDSEIQQEEARLKVSQELIRNYNQLQKERDRMSKLLEDSSWELYTCTGYSANDIKQGTNNVVATTFNLDYQKVKDLPIIAADPEVIPLYSIAEIEGLGGFISLDTGGKIVGRRIDILFDSKEEALNWGIKYLFVRVLD